MWSHRRWRALVVATGVLAMLPASASAAGIDRTSDHAALNAYHAYLGGVMSRIPAVRAADGAFISSVSKRCRNALAPLRTAPASSVSTTALFEFGEELGGDVAVEAYRPARGELAKMAAALRRLRWSSPRTGKMVKAYLTAQGKLFRLAPSDLCTDARALAGSNAQRTPRGTIEWLAKFRSAIAAQQAGSRAFVAVLKRFEVPADKALVASDNRLFRHVVSSLQGVAKVQAGKLLAVLDRKSGV
jgi:hypothetical protein